MIAALSAPLCLCGLLSAGPAFQPVISYALAILGAAILIAIFIVFAAGTAAQVLSVDCEDASAPLVILSSDRRRHPSSSLRPFVPSSPSPDLPCLRCGTAIPAAGRVFRCLPETGHPVTEIEICEACGAIRESVCGYPKEYPFSDTFTRTEHPQDHEDLLAAFSAERLGTPITRRPGCQTHERHRGPATTRGLNPRVPLQRDRAGGLSPLLVTPAQAGVQTPGPVPLPRNASCPPSRPVSSVLSRSPSSTEEAA